MDQLADAEFSSLSMQSACWRLASTATFGLERIRAQLGENKPTETAAA